MTNMYLKITTISMTIIFLILYGFSFGKWDKIAILFFIVSVLIIFYQIHEIHILSKQVLREHTKNDGRFYNFLSGSSVFTFVTAFIFSLFSSIILLLVLKGLLINHHFLFTITIIIFCSYFISIYLEKQNINNFEDEFKENLSLYANKIINLILVVFLVNFLSTCLFTFLDTWDFIQSKITLNNFEEFAIKNKISKNENGYNDVSRIIINIVLLFDNLKMAFVNFLIEELFKESKSDNIFSCFFIIFIFNFIKFFAFSFSLVYLQKTFYDMVKKYS